MKIEMEESFEFHMSLESVKFFVNFKLWLSSYFILVTASIALIEKCLYMCKACEFSSNLCELVMS